MSDNGTPLLSMRGVAKYWPGMDTPVISGVDLDLPCGSIYWVVGDNGAGKTTLLRIAAALVLPNMGYVRVLGIDPEKERRRYQQQLGLLTAGDSGLYARQTVRHHLDLWARLAFVPRNERRAAVERTIEEFGLGELADRRCDRMSMGQRQRVRLAMTFLHQPRLLLLDEPRNSLDSTGIADLVTAVDRTVKRGGGALWCSPSGEEPSVRYDRILTIEDHELRAQDHELRTA